VKCSLLLVMKQVAPPSLCSVVVPVIVNDEGDAYASQEL
jgi:hypothetical protein